MKIALIFPNLSDTSIDRRMIDRVKFEIRGIYPPLGLAYIASILEEDGHEMAFLDANAECLTLSEIRDRIVTLQPNVAGLYCATLMINEVRSVARAVREVNPGITTIVGGPHLAVFPDATMAFSEFDIGVIGEGENTVRELATALESGGDLTKVKGIAFKKGEKTIKTEPREYVTDLDALPFPAWHLLPVSKYRDILTRRPGRSATMITSRGCPFRCIYCSAECRLGRKFRYRSPDNILEEMLYLRDTFGVREICFYDDTFTVRKDRIAALCALLIERDADIEWECRTRVDLVDREMLANMSRAGCFRIRYGVESGSDRILRRLRKGITVERTEEAVSMTVDNGIEAFGYFMIGCPGETRDTVEKTAGLIRRLDFDYVNVNILAIRPPGSELFQWAADEGFIDPDYWLRYSAGEPLDPAPQLVSRELSARKLESFQKRMYRGFYLRPIYLVKVLLDPAKIRIVFRLVRSLAILCLRRLKRGGR